MTRRSAPSTLATRLGELAVRTRWLVLVGAVAVLAVGVVWGTGVFDRLTAGGFTTPGSESARALSAVEQDLGRRAPQVAVVYRDASGTVDDTAFRSAVEGALGDLPRTAVEDVITTWSGGPAGLVSADRHSTLVLLRLVGTTEDELDDSYEAIADDLVVPGLETLRGGQAATFADVNAQVSADLARAESISLPLVLLLLLAVFGSLAAALLPLAIGGLAILGAFLLLNVLTRFTDVSVYAVNIVTMLGLGLAVDYSLFVVSRFREELAARGGGRDVVAPALGATLLTAGRTVLFSGVTVAVSLTALMMFPNGFLRSMGYGAVAAVGVAMLGALTVLPALLAVLGPRVDALRLPWSRRRSRSGDSTRWERVAQGVMRRPLVVAGTLSLALVVLALPFLRISFGGIDARVLPAGTESRVATEVVDRDFPQAAAETVDVVVRGAEPEQVQAYAVRLAQVPGATGALVTESRGSTAVVGVTHSGPAVGDTARRLVETVRSTPGPDGAQVLVGGQAAELVDLLDSLGDRLPLAAGFVVVVTLLLLFLAFGSVVLPVKAVVMNVLSLSAMFGVVVWVFQEGHLASWFGVTPTGTIEATQPVLMVAIAFGLSMDYEVFLLSRIREEWDRTHDNTAAVAAGLARTGRIITSAALLLVVVIGAFATSGISFLTMIGVGLATAIVLDATVVRALLVPATMRLLGRANWWAPAPLARWWERHGLRESPVAPRHRADRRPLQRV
jgi:uncharacterized membrane protein YdfJ with MMPL/SSD domain